MKKSKVTIFGSYNKNSIGDKAILISLLDLLFRNATNNLTVDVFTFQISALKDDIKDYPWKDCVNLVPVIENFEDIKKSENFTKQKTYFDKLPNFLKTIASYFIFKKIRSSYKVEDSDGLIIGGGNLLMDIFPSWPARPYLIQRTFLKNNKPTFLLGVGAFPINNFVSKFFLKSIVNKSEAIFVRDNKSKLFIKEKWDKRVKWGPDLAFSLPIETKQKIKIKNHHTCAINVAPLYGPTWPQKDDEKYKKYIKEVSKQLFDYYKSLDNVIFHFYDTNYPTDSIASKSVISELIELGISKDDIRYEEKLHTCKELCSIISSSNLALTTRLHAGILALRLHKPILAIEYQPKVASVLESVGIDNKNVIKIDELKKISRKLLELTSHEGDTLTKEKINELDKINSKIIKEILKSIST